MLFGWKMCVCVFVPPTATAVDACFPLVCLPRLPACSNVMLTEGLRARVGDLGSALWLGCTAVASAVGFSSTHAAPEAMLGERCSLAADIYSLGILLIELTTLEPVARRGGWRMPSAPHDCPQVSETAAGRRRTADLDCMRAGWWLLWRLFHSLVAVPAPDWLAAPCPALGMTDAVRCAGLRGPHCGVHRERPCAAPQRRTGGAAAG